MLPVRIFHRKECSERIFAYEDYSMYYIIDLCAQQYMETHKNNDLIYLIHPSIIKIGRYDAQHNTNLREVLYFYLLCGCNLLCTAKVMYMHCNTILNKLNKINEIIQIPLEDGYKIFVQAEIPWVIFIHVFFSCFLFLHLLYYSYYFPENSFPKF